VKDQSRITVEGVNLVTKHERKSQENPEGTSSEREMSIHYSNVVPAAKYDAKRAR
jgi:large subunit ribosomal protein L24